MVDRISSTPIHRLWTFSTTLRRRGDHLHAALPRQRGSAGLLRWGAGVHELPDAECGALETERVVVVGCCGLEEGPFGGCRFLRKTRDGVLGEL